MRNTKDIQMASWKKRKVDKVWKANHLVNRKLTALKRLEDAKKRAEENNQN